MENQININNAKKWYSSNGGIIALLFFFFPVGLFLMWKFAHWNTWIKGGVTGVFVILLIATISSSSSSTSSQPTSNGNVIASVSKTVPTETPTPQKPLTLQDKLGKITDSMGLERDATKISYNPSTTEVMVTYNIAKHWTDTHLGDLTPITLLNSEVNKYVPMAGQMFQLDGVGIVGIDYKTTFNDSYGNSNLDDAWQFSMAKATYSKFNWKNLENQPIFDKLIDNTRGDDYFINPSIQAALNDAGHDQVKLGKLTL